MRDKKWAARLFFDILRYYWIEIRGLKTHLFAFRADSGWLHGSGRSRFDLCCCSRICGRRRWSPARDFRPRTMPLCSFDCKPWCSVSRMCCLFPTRGPPVSWTSAADHRRTPRCTPRTASLLSGSKESNCAVCPGDLRSRIMWVSTAYVDRKRIVCFMGRVEIILRSFGFRWKRFWWEKYLMKLGIAE